MQLLVVTSIDRFSRRRGDVELKGIDEVNTHESGCVEPLRIDSQKEIASQKRSRPSTQSKGVARWKGETPPPKPKKML